MQTTLTIRPEPRYRSYIRTAILIVGIMAIAPVAVPIILIPETIPRIVFGIFASIEILIAVLVDRWAPHYIQSLEYVVGDRSVRMKGGVFWRRQVTVPFSKITNVDTSQGPLERYFRIGTVHVQTAGAGGAEGARAELKIGGVADLEHIRSVVLVRIGADDATPADGTMDDGGHRVALTEEVVPENVTGCELLTAILAELRGIRRLLSRPNT